ncbi:MULTISPECIES: cytochrome b/b6 domain-containing protein [Gemmobacter]|jgi:cytochrome b|uniref:Cytochrome b n=2 Tax=Gemmobacter TaxID=204456 RepID=A0A2T6BB66_9RHOB|nr:MULTISPECIES: cytochrome b/b6 domain-containing protein [Gemmobacter]PTX53320.1 cytochrome b [Gemmobacter caeni]TWJ05431.1 cytochrome b [Gemmobacter caeni]GHC16063.1 cytochrome b561 [Gemmobacter nanjingensis]
MTEKTYIWDGFVRLFHWSLALAFAANALFTNPEHDLHHWIGYFVLALVAARIVWGVIGSRHARFSDFPPSLSAAFDQAAEMAAWRRRPHHGHSPLGALMIYNLLITLIIVGISGYMQTTLMFFGREWVEELHEVAVTWAEISVVAHIAAVALESRRLRINLPVSMVTGYKRLPRD